MKAHLTTSDLLKYINGKTSAKIMLEAALHISKCSKCEKKYFVLSNVLAPAEDDYSEPDIRVEKRLITTFGSMNKQYSGNVVPIYDRRKKVIRRMLSAAAVIAVVGISVFFGSSYIIDREKLPIYVYYFKGTPTIDNEQVAYHMPIRDRSHIKVAAGEVLVLAYKNRFIVKIHQQSELKLKKLKERSARGDHQFVFDLRKGTLFTRYNQNSHDTKYFYFTPNATLAATKSSFIMKVAGNRTIVIPKEGAINIRSLDNQDSVAAAPMKEYVITSTVESFDTTGESAGTELRIELDKPFSEEEIISLKDILESMS